MYEDIYKKISNVWGGKINLLLEEALAHVNTGNICLDLGCGQGKELFYLSKKGFGVDGVEISKIAVDQIRNIISDENFIGISVEEADIAKYNICKDKYDLIISFDVLHFLERKDIYRVINEIKNKIKNGGIVAICAFTEKNSTYESKKTKVKYHFRENELHDMFEDFKIIYYSEDIINGKAHELKGYPHKHGIVKIIAKK